MLKGGGSFYTSKVLIIDPFLIIPNAGAAFIRHEVISGASQVTITGHSFSEAVQSQCSYVMRLPATVLI